jgi:hypothetical protein
MELFARLLGGVLLFVYHCFDGLVIHGYLSGLSRPEQVVYFFRQVVGVPAITKEVLGQRTTAIRTGSRPLPATRAFSGNGPSLGCGRKTLSSFPCAACITGTSTVSTSF